MLAAVTTATHLLLVDDEPGIREMYGRLLARAGYRVTVAEDAERALQILRSDPAALMITDIRMPGMDGLELVRRARQIDARLKVVIITAHADTDSAIEALTLGAHGYLRKPFGKQQLLDALGGALTIQVAEIITGKAEPETPCDFTGIVGQSEPLERVFRMVRRVAPSDATILLNGESGTGKELFARAIHANSQRSNGRFVSINCGALPEALLESELFGHVRGSFTGAVRDKEGLLLYASGGTFFMDEIGDMAASTQVKLLRVLEEREVVPVGETKPQKVDVRVLVATNVDLEERVKEGRFRADLFYRINVIPIRIPALRERKEDIPILVAHLLQKHLRPSGQPAKSFNAAAMEKLTSYNWPGNVRELENLVQRCLMLCDGPVIGPSDIHLEPEARREGPARLSADSSGELGDLTLDELERRHILRVLERTGWHRKKTAAILGIDPSTLYRKLERFGITSTD
ncbi:MAG: sigma-54 dependent transcriptional regulator [Candidatus Eisenbacteria bacterium]|jgi:DNA-binding NtrC family response regulator|nr:sigma-54 dependent transcriptional regulator [Candidatus Eisenbacteria bacterium]